MGDPITLTDFLLARIAEVREFATAIEDVTYRPRWKLTPSGPTQLVTLGLDPKALMLAECEAKRHIVAEHLPATDEVGVQWCRCCQTSQHTSRPWPCGTLTLLALPYADHPDYRAEWRP